MLSAVMLSAVIGFIVGHKYASSRAYAEAVSVAHAAQLEALAGYAEYLRSL